MFIFLLSSSILIIAYDIKVFLRHDYIILHNNLVFDLLSYVIEFIIPYLYIELEKSRIGKTVDDFIMEPGKNVVLMLYWATCPHCEALHPGFESVAARVESAMEDMPASGSEIVFGRIEGTRNDIGHRRVYAGSYPLVYYIPADDKENPLQLQDARDESGIWRFLQENTWIGEADKDDL